MEESPELLGDGGEPCGGGHGAWVFRHHLRGEAGVNKLIVIWMILASTLSAAT